MRLRFLLAAYGAAGLSFLASLVRDYAVIHYSGQDKLFFQLLYVASMAAGFGVNAIALGSGSIGRPGLLVLAALGAVLIVVLAPEHLSGLPVLLLLMAILVLWIAGAQWSRVLVERGWVFLGRVREAVASVVLALLVLVGARVDLSFLFAVACGCGFSWLMARMARTARGTAPHARPEAARWSALAQSILLTNVATFAITYWALWQTGRAGSVFGVENSTAVRFAMYAYQVLTIGSVVLVSRTARLAHARHLVGAVCLAAALFAAAWFMPLSLALLLVPLSAAVTHYGMVLYLQQRGKAPV